MAVGSLIALGGNLENPRDSKPSDYPAVGPSGAAGSSSGEGQLVKQSVNQEGPRHSQDDGDQTGAKWGKADWTIGKSTGGGGTSVSYKGAVDFNTGQMVPCSVDQTY